jgi:hypothetical protein
MNIKSLLLGSAAALSMVVSAHAADAIVAAEPEPAEYVKVCDAFGTGYFYIPGTETCLKIGGYVRYQVDFGSDLDGATAGDQRWNSWTKGDLQVTAKSDSEFGAVTGYLELVAKNDHTTSNVTLDAAYLSVGGLKAGYYAGYWDAGIGENSSWNTNAKFNSIGYEFSGEGFSAGVQIDDYQKAGGLVDSNLLGVQGMVSASAGSVKGTLYGAYDTDASEGALKAILSAEVGPGTLDLAGIWNSGANIYYTKEWTVGAAYSIKASDKLTIMPEFQYAEDFAGTESWFVGALTSYQIADGLKASLDVNYNNDDTVGGYVRLQRSF